MLAGTQAYAGDTARLSMQAENMRCVIVHIGAVSQHWTLHDNPAKGCRPAEDMRRLQCHAADTFHMQAVKCHSNCTNLGCEGKCHA